MPRPPPPKLALMMTGYPTASAAARTSLEARRRLVHARHDRHSVGAGQLLRRHLVAERLELFGRRADERDAGRCARARKLGVLGQEPVAGMNRVDAVAQRHFDDGRDVQVRADRLASFGRSDQKRFVGLEAVQREAILVAVDRHGLQPELGGGAKTADGDFRTVGDEQLLHSESIHDRDRRGNRIGRLMRRFDDREARAAFGERRRIGRSRQDRARAAAVQHDAAHRHADAIAASATVSAT